MSQENVERLHAFLRGLGSEVWETHGEPDLSLLDPDVVCEDDVLPDHAGESYRGHEGVIRSYRICLEAYEEFRIELEQIAGSGDRLISIHRFRGKGRHTGIEDGGRYAYLWTFREGKVIHFRTYRNPAEALEAVGLRE
jgi:ketosteroid isomerase-like protein